jgi:hypothetical protein
LSVTLSAKEIVMNFNFSNAVAISMTNIDDLGWLVKENEYRPLAEEKFDQLEVAVLKLVGMADYTPIVKTADKTIREKLLAYLTKRLAGANTYFVENELIASLGIPREVLWKAVD